MLWRLVAFGTDIESHDRGSRAWSWLFATAVAFALGVYYLRAADILLLPRVGLQPWLMRNGFRGFSDIVDQHEVGLPWLLSVLLPAFDDPLSLAQWTLAGLAATCVLLVQAGAPSRFAPLAVLFFACWVPVVWGGRLWYETALAPLYLGAYVAWPGHADAPRWRIAASGLLLGVAVTVKQYAWALVGLYLLTAVLVGRDAAAARSRAAVALLFGAGVALPFSVYVTWIAANGSFSDYVFWAWVNNLSAYRGQAAKLPDRHGALVAAALLLPALALLVAAVRAGWRGVPVRDRPGLLSVLALAASATVYPRFEIFHLGAALPLCAVAVAAASDFAWPRRTASRPGVRFRSGLAVCVALAVALSLWILVPQARQLTPSRPRQFIWYADLMPLAARVRQITEPNDPVLVFPDVEPTSNLYLLSRRRPPGIWAYTYPWYASDTVLRRIIEAMETQRPPVVVYIPGQGVDGLAAEDYAAPLAMYIRQHYTEREELPTAVGVAKIMTRRGEAADER